MIRIVPEPVCCTLLGRDAASYCKFAELVCTLVFAAFIFTCAGAFNVIFFGTVLSCEPGSVCCLFIFVMQLFKTYALLETDHYFSTTSHTHIFIQCPSV